MSASYSYLYAALAILPYWSIVSTETAGMLCAYIVGLFVNIASNGTNIMFGVALCCG